MNKKGKNKYYTLNNLLKYDCQYYMAFGKRSNGKSYSVLEYGLKKYLDTGEQTAIVRRNDIDFIGKRGQQMFSNLECNGEGENVVAKLSKGKWEGIYYYSSRWWLYRIEDDKKVVDDTPFCYGFALTGQEHDKSTSYPRVTTILFDEFLSRNGYLPDEFIILMNTISTIIRKRNNVKIFMMGNTISQYCPYFTEMGLTHVKRMKQGEIEIYTYGQSGLRVAVEYAPQTDDGKDGGSSAYFAFDNPKLNMITNGSWELAIYPHCPCKFKPKEILFTYFIVFDGDILQCEIVQHDDVYFTFIHRKTTELKNPDEDLIFSPEISARRNWVRKINKPFSPLTNSIAQFFREDKVFYSDNEVGEIVHNYLLWCGRLN